MDKVLYEIYRVAADYICGRSDDEQLECISRICDLYMQICNENEEIPSEIDGLLQSAVNHINHDVEDGKTLEEHITDGYSILEELSGSLGQYFE